MKDEKTNATPTDPFHADAERIAPKSGQFIDWRRLSPGEPQLCKAIGERCAAMVGAVADRSKVLMFRPSPIWCGADIACAHLTRPLDLKKMLEADDLQLMACYVAIAGRINRATGHVANMDHPDIARFYAPGFWNKLRFDILRFNSQ